MERIGLQVCDLRFMCSWTPYVTEIERIENRDGDPNLPDALFAAALTRNDSFGIRLNVGNACQSPRGHFMDKFVVVMHPRSCSSV